MRRKDKWCWAGGDAQPLHTQPTSFIPFPMLVSPQITLIPHFSCLWIFPKQPLTGLAQSQDTLPLPISLKSMILCYESFFVISVAPFKGACLSFGIEQESSL